jgi:acyl-CoA thioesterase-1
MFWTVLFFLSAFPGCGTRHTQNTQAEPDFRNIQAVSNTPFPEGAIVCLGDSLTAGLGASFPDQEDRSRSFPAFLQEKVNIPVVNAGVSGNTTHDALYRLNRDVISKNPRIVLIELGGNDILNHIDLMTTYNNFNIIINNLNMPGVKLYLVKFYNYGMIETLITAIGLPPAFAPEVMRQYDELFYNLAAQYNIEVIDTLWNGAWGRYMSDSIHATAEGYRIMAGNVFRNMEPYLRANNLLK